MVITMGRILNGRRRVIKDAGGVARVVAVAVAVAVVPIESRRALPIIVPRFAASIIRKDAPP
jgi:hypothetical protein